MKPKPVTDLHEDHIVPDIGDTITVYNYTGGIFHFIHDHIWGHNRTERAVKDLLDIEDND